ncbi:MAG: GNAT family N-acetyltransferase [Candidatus Aenigmarchaeota archaeon]|nr:GNAT family N-acetyltransferase [Candidatus Aenigmarchaeota archaeon]
MKIIKAGRKDEKLLAKFLVSYWKSRGMNFSVPWALKYLKKGMTCEMSEERFVVIDNENIIGSIALLKYYENFAEIRDEVWEDDKIGSSLLNYLIQYAKKRKIKKIYTLALKNKVNFYRKHKFIKEGFLRDHVKKREHLTVMSKFLR